MHVVLCGKCRQRMSWQINTEHVTAGCPCGMRLAAQYIFAWHEIPVALRAHATKTFGIRGKWRIQPLKALEVAGAVIRSVASASAATRVLVGQR